MSNPHLAYPTSPISLVRNVWKYKHLVLQMTKRDVLGRYKGSVIGLGWSFLTPFFMLAVYTFVFSVVFKARWSVGGEESRTQFAVILFAGMIAHGLFAEVVNRAPHVILDNANYVKKVVFPLEILPVINLCSALFHFMISFLVLLGAFLLFNGYLHWTLIFTPLVLLPLIIFCMGLSWILASVGVFVRDIGQTTAIITTVMMFLSPVFFPITAIPEKYRIWIMLNPLTFIIEQVRNTLIWGKLPDWGGLLIYTCVATIIAWLGYVWFQKIRKGFADVL